MLTLQLQGTISAGSPLVGASPPPLTALATVKELEQFANQNPFTAEEVAALSVGNVVPFGPVVNAKFIWINTDGPITLKITSAAGAVQEVPCDGTFIVKTRDVPITEVTYDVGASFVNVNGIVAGD